MPVRRNFIYGTIHASGFAGLEIALAAARHLKHRQAEGATLGNLGLAYVNMGESAHSSLRSLRL